MGAVRGNLREWERKGVRVDGGPGHVDWQSHRPPVQGKTKWTLL
jgi:hypothetical protein